MLDRPNGKSALSPTQGRWEGSLRDYGRLNQPLWSQRRYTVGRRQSGFPASFSFPTAAVNPIHSDNIAPERDRLSPTALHSTYRCYCARRPTSHHPLRPVVENAPARPLRHSALIPFSVSSTRIALSPLSLAFLILSSFRVSLRSDPVVRRPVFRDSSDNHIGNSYSVLVLDFARGEYKKKKKSISIWTCLIRLVLRRECEETQQAEETSSMF